MLTLKTVNGNDVAEMKLSKKAVKAGTDFVDIASSGDVGALLEDEWRVRAVGKLFGKLTPEVKLEVFVWAIKDMDNQGWHVEDIRALMELCGIEKCEIAF
jgi:hypothetical protein